MIICVKLNFLKGTSVTKWLRLMTSDQKPNTTGLCSCPVNNLTVMISINLPMVGGWGGGDFISQFTVSVQSFNPPPPLSNKSGSYDTDEKLLKVTINTTINLI